VPFFQNKKRLSLGFCLPKHYATDDFKANHRSYSPSIRLHFDPKHSKIELFSKELEQNENSTKLSRHPVV